MNLLRKCQNSYYTIYSNRMKPSEQFSQVGQTILKPKASNMRTSKSTKFHKISVKQRNLEGPVQVCNSRIQLLIIFLRGEMTLPPLWGSCFQKTCYFFFIRITHSVVNVEGNLVLFGTAFFLGQRLGFGSPESRTLGKGLYSYFIRGTVLGSRVRDKVERQEDVKSCCQAGCI